MKIKTSITNITHWMINPFLKKLSVIMVLIINIPFFNNCSNKKSEPEQTISIVKNDPLTYKLPGVAKKGSISVEEALSQRRTHRNYSNRKLNAQEVSQILWASYGISQLAPDEPYIKGGYRTSPSAGAVYPLIIYLISNNLKDIEPGVYLYDPEQHTLIQKIGKDIKKELTAAALDQQMITDAPACIIISSTSEKMIERYGDTLSKKFIYMEAGHVAQNVYLQAESLRLGTCSIGAFIEKDVKAVLQLQDNEEPLYIMPIGKYYNDN